MTIATAPIIDTQPLLLDVSNTTLTVTPEQFDLLCVDNPDLRLELTPDLKLIVMAPAKPQDRTFRSATDNLKPLQDKNTKG
jgi:Uma2 family endonuclease